MDDPNEQSETFQPPPTLIVVTLCDQVIEFLAAYGWYLLAVGLAIIFYWERIQSFLNQRQREQSEKEYEAKCKKDPDWLHQRQKEMESARKRMQEESDRKAAEHAVKMKEKEEQKRAALIASNTNGGQRLGYGDEATTSASIMPSKLVAKKPNRPEYHPLMGSGSSGGYRPPRRGCPGGGCG